LAFPFFARRHLVGVELTRAEIRRAVRAALAEDLGSGDVTTLATIPASAKSIARMSAREPLSSRELDLPNSPFANCRRKSKSKKLSATGSVQKPATLCWKFLVPAAPF
jgi:nicotinate-nucleotide pyrophosphorylase